MPDFYLNLHLTRWPRWSSMARAEASAGQPLDQVLVQLTGFAEHLQSGELDIAFLREHVGAFLAEAFASAESGRVSRVYGDDEPLGEGWRLHIEGLTPAEVARMDACMEDIFQAGVRSDSLTRMVRLDEELGLYDR